MSAALKHDPLRGDYWEVEDRSDITVTIADSGLPVFGPNTFAKMREMTPPAIEAFWIVKKVFPMATILFVNEREAEPPPERWWPDRDEAEDYIRAGVAY